MLVFVWIMLMLCSMLAATDYDQIYAHLIGAALFRGSHVIQQEEEELETHCVCMIASSLSVFLVNATYRYSFGYLYMDAMTAKCRDDCVIILTPQGRLRERY